MHVRSTPVMIALAAVKGLTKDQFPTAPNLGVCLSGVILLRPMGLRAPMHGCIDMTEARSCSSTALLSVVNLHTIVSLGFIKIESSLLRTFLNWKCS